MTVNMAWLRSSFLRGSLLAIAVAASGSANAAAFFDITGTSNPWDVVAGGLNSSFDYGSHDGSGPTIANFALAGITPGSSWAVLFVSGLTSAFGGMDPVNNNGYVGSTFKDDALGASDTYFPSHYMPSNWNADPGAGLFLNALVAAFTDDSGQIVGDPFSVGTVFLEGMDYSYLVGVGGSATPAGATRIQLGLNDDIFADNTGSLKVCVGSSLEDCDALISDPGPVPEPATWAMMLVGFGLVGGAMRRRRQGVRTSSSYA